MDLQYRMVAKTFQGLERVLAEELKQIGAKNIEEGNRAVLFDGDKAIMYRANYHCRTAISILKPIAEFNAKHEEHLYKEIGKINWKAFINTNQTLSVTAVTFGDLFPNSKYVALKVKDAIVDQFRRREGDRPNVDTQNPDLKIQIHISHNKCRVMLDSSGDPLFKRGYRIKTNKAPINEVLAAGMVLLSGWKMDCDLIDPMCGSGTILIEAALIANGIAPGTYRKRFGFENWNDFDADLFDEIAEESYLKNEFKHSIIGGDVSANAVEIAEENIKNAFLAKKIKLKKQNFFDTRPQFPGVVITNPPYGERLQPDDLKIFYQKIGDKLKLDYLGFNAWLIGSNVEIMKYIGLRPEKKLKLFNGPLECSYRKFSIYDGSKKRND